MLGGAIIGLRCSFFVCSCSVSSDSLVALGPPIFFNLAVVDVAVDPRVEFLDLGDVAALSAVFCVLRIFWLMRSDLALLEQQVMPANGFRSVPSGEKSRPPLSLRAVGN